MKCQVLRSSYDRWKLKVAESLNTECDFNSNQNYEHKYNREVKRYAKKYKITEEELKEYITISVLMNFDFFDYSDANVKLIKEIESDTVKDIQIFCSSYLPMNEIIYEFKDDRIKGNSYDCYKPYFNLEAKD